MDAQHTTPLRCDDLRNEPGFPGCCDSCHDDEDAGYDSFCELYDSDRLTHIVCCKVWEWLRKRTA